MKLRDPRGLVHAYDPQIWPKGACWGVWLDVTAVHDEMIIALKAEIVLDAGDAVPVTCLACLARSR